MAPAVECTGAVGDPDPAGLPLNGSGAVRSDDRQQGYADLARGLALPPLAGDGDWQHPRCGQAEYPGEPVSLHLLSSSGSFTLTAKGSSLQAIPGCDLHKPGAHHGTRTASSAQQHLVRYMDSVFASSRTET
jgi:hypothetical protein